MLPWLDAARLQADIAAAIGRQRPDAVITFDEDGVYGHPDHVAVHERTTAVVAALGRAGPALYYAAMPRGAMRTVADHAARTYRAGAAPPGDRPFEARGRSPRGPRPEPPAPTPTVTSLPSGSRRPPRPRHGRAAAMPPGTPPTAILGVHDPDAFGAEAPAPTLVVDARTFAAAKLAALACHATQFRGSALEAVAPEDAPRLLGVEHYRRAPVGAPGLSFLDAFAAPGPAAAAEKRRRPAGCAAGAGQAQAR